jgi:hypothetical protein
MPDGRENLMPDIRLSPARGPFVRLALESLGAVDHDVSDFVALPQILRLFRQWLEP